MHPTIAVPRVFEGQCPDSGDQCLLFGILPLPVEQLGTAHAKQLTTDSLRQSLFHQQADCLGFLRWGYHFFNTFSNACFARSVSAKSFFSSAFSFSNSFNRLASRTSIPLYFLRQA